jgi:hypothetical protein
LLLYSPNVDNVEIPCKLIYCSVNDALSYMALSYTWGPPQPAHQIFVNEKRFSVRSNLWHFLNSLPRLRNYSESCSTDATRRPESDNINAHEHVFWVDAVCIYPDRHRTKCYRNLRFEPLFCEGVGFARLACRFLEPERALTTLFRLLRAGSGSFTIRSLIAILSHSLARLERIHSNKVGQRS